MKGLLLLVLSCTIELALSKTVNYNIEKECNEGFVRNSLGALAYAGTYNAKKEKGCEFGFRLTSNQKDFTFRLEHLTTNSKQGVMVKIQQYKNGEPSHHAKTLLNVRLYNTTDYSVKFNSSEDYEQKVLIEIMDDDRHGHGHGHDDYSFNLDLVITPSFWSVFCRGAALKSSYYLCNSTSACIHGQLQCDGYNNCAAGEDEQSCGSTTPNQGSTNSNSNFSTTPKPYPWSTVGLSSTEVPVLNQSYYTTSNTTVVYVLWWWHSWYITSMILISGFLAVLLLIGLSVCCVQTFVSSCKKNKVRTTPTSTSVNSRSTPVPETMQVSVIQSKAYSELPPAYAAVVQSPPEYSHVTVFLDSPCGNSNAH